MATPNHLDDQLPVQREAEGAANADVVERRATLIEFEQQQPRIGFGLRRHDILYVTHLRGRVGTAQPGQLHAARPQGRHAAAFIGNDAEVEAIEIRQSGLVIVWVALQPHQRVRPKIFQHEWPRADAPLDEVTALPDVLAADDRGIFDRGKIVEERGKRIGEAKDDRPRIRRIDRADDREDRHPRRARRGIDQALERELDVLARERVAIVEFYAVAQMEDERLRIRILP